MLLETVTRGMTRTVSLSSIIKLKCLLDWFGFNDAGAFGTPASIDNVYVCHWFFWHFCKLFSL